MDDAAVLTQRFAGPRIIGPSERAPPPPPSAISFGGTQFTPPSGPLPGPTGPPPPTGGVSLASTVNKSPMPGPVGPPPAAARDALGFALPHWEATSLLCRGRLARRRRPHGTPSDSRFRD